MNVERLRSVPFLLLTLTALIAGCDRDRTVASTGDSTGATSTAASATPGGAPSGADASVVSDTPIAAEDIDLGYSILSGPSYDAATDAVSYMVRVQNNGKAVLTSAGKAPVNLGVVIRDGKGTMDGPPAKQDFVRVPLPVALKPGATTDVAIAFPATPTFGGIAVLDAVQEGVDWFTGYGKPVLDLGRFQRCPSNSETVCQADGTPVPAKTP